MKITMDLARKIAAQQDMTEWYKNLKPAEGATKWEYLRDVCDTASGQDLECFPLNMLTDWVQKILDKEAEENNNATPTPK